MLKSKDEFFDSFKLWLLKAEVGESRLDYLQIDSREKFISVVFQSFCQKWEIKIKYIASYIYKENNIVEQCLRTFA